MEAAAGEAQGVYLRLAFDCRLKLEFHGTKVTSDGGLLACRELDDALGLSETAGEGLTDTRTGANGRPTLVGQFRQSVIGRLAGYEDVNDADRLAHDPALRWIVGGRAVTQNAASPSQMGRFETEVLTQKANLSALADLCGRWIDRVHARRPVRGIVLDLDSSVSPTYGDQESSAYNGHFGCTCYHPHDDDLVLGFARIEPKPGPRRSIRPPKPRHVVEDRGEQINGNDHVKRPGPA